MDRHEAAEDEQHDFHGVDRPRVEAQVRGHHSAEIGEEKLFGQEKEDEKENDDDRFDERGFDFKEYFIFKGNGDRTESGDQGDVEHDEPVDPVRFDIVENELRRGKGDGRDDGNRDIVEKRVNDNENDEGERLPKKLFNEHGLPLTVRFELSFKQSKNSFSRAVQF